MTRPLHVMDGTSKAPACITTQLPDRPTAEWLYGHNWVALAWLATHPVWGVIAMPLRSMLYVREVDVPKLAEKV